MLYTMYEAGYYAASPLRFAARAARGFWSSPLNPAKDSDLGRRLFAGADLFANLTRRYGRPAWNINSVQIDGKPVRVTQTEVWSSPWVKLTHFSRNMADMRKAGRRDLQPAVLIVAPLSGHYATLLRGTVEAFLQDHEVFITDWSNARDVPLHAGRFDFHDYLDHVREMLRLLGPRPHVVAVCQPGPAVLAAAALMAQDNEDCRPGTMTFMGSPIDARLSPTVTNKLAEERPFAWFKSNMIDTVPAPYPGLGRRVYPGFVQLYSFMSMNAEKHQDAHKQYLEDLMKGDGDATDKHLEFYDEYLSVLDLPEEFYLQTVDYVFQSYLLPKGELTHRGRAVQPALITDIGLLTVEGENDDISGIGQTQAAHTLCSGLPAEFKEDYVQPHVGHYGVFNGRRFREEIYPRVRAFIRKSEAGFEKARDAANAA
ncbi:MAG: polyhydroxyalkanoate depolymerase [Phenylobacterium sp.]|uniref:polyhydroxyalkanoate depolymerase n=1 Tax=Phenylobacterium sp. TaxID=1871053 RepID=UPI001B702C2E|nr:polyhydroxyalkanoate depolymerase [Phenylobacterium sp.]MBP7648842.1 polyhydroxyalkanoate depolymerase [Phenylobacterium sp.]MBP7816613.1 polyhydroxyalkanoate depolymerase [Phenylobacterium sp.]MBP9230000.1 polyhydroxyalkanoate depolymerase [Phenylobacterium sp.]MBP9755956.1 polyhydroxyalkanoate depolymerase [Phenylobacterium sp.]